MSPDVRITRQCSRSGLLAFTVLACAAPALTASASDVRLDRARPGVAGVASKPATMADLVAASDLVFRGQVESLETILSEPAGPDRTRVPYTLVRYRVHDVIHGIADGSTVTLRFIGGIDPRSGLLMMTSSTPEFVEGDEDILFVRGNGTSLSPLVGELDGRVRVLEGRAWSETGRPVRGFLDFRPALRPAEALFADDLAERLRGAAAAVAPAGRFKSVRSTDVAFAPDVTPAPPPFDAHAEDALRAPRRLAAERDLQDAEGVAR